jgi:hypothetical protein
LVGPVQPHDIRGRCAVRKVPGIWMPSFAEP